MFDLGWTELLLIAVVALIVVPPKDLPGMFRTAGQWMGQIRRMARDFQRTMEDAADDAGMSEVSKVAGSLKDVGRAASGGMSGLAKFGLDEGKKRMDAANEKPADTGTDAKPADATTTKPEAAEAKPDVPTTGQPANTATQPAATPGPGAASQEGTPAETKSAPSAEPQVATSPGRAAE